MNPGGPSPPGGLGMASAAPPSPDRPRLGPLAASSWLRCWYPGRCTRGRSPSAADGVRHATTAVTTPRPRTSRAGHPLCLTGVRVRPGAPSSKGIKNGWTGPVQPMASRTTPRPMSTGATPWSGEHGVAPSRRRTCSQQRSQDPGLFLAWSASLESPTLGQGTTPSFGVLLSREIIG